MGFPANIKKIKKIIKGKNIKILEDCCESPGAKIGRKNVGNFGIASSFSFYWGHHMTTIEGGMICTNNLQFYNLCKMKRSHGFARELSQKNHPKLKKKFSNIDFNFLFLTDGYNLRSTNLNAFIGIRQLKRLNSFIIKRNENYKKYLNCLKNYRDNFYIMSNSDTNLISSFALPFIFKEKNFFIKFKKLLTKHKIEFRSLIAGDLTKQPYLFKYKKRNLNAEIIHKKGIYIGNNQFVGKKNFLILEKILFQTFDY